MLNPQVHSPDSQEVHSPCIFTSTSWCLLPLWRCNATWADIAVQLHSDVCVLLERADSFSCYSSYKNHTFDFKQECTPDFKVIFSLFFLLLFFFKLKVFNINSDIGRFFCSPLNQVLFVLFWMKWATLNIVEDLRVNSDWFRHEQYKTVLLQLVHY